MHVRTLTAVVAGIRVFGFAVVLVVVAALERFFLRRVLFVFVSWRVTLGLCTCFKFIFKSDWAIRCLSGSIRSLKRSLLSCRDRGGLCVRLGGECSRVGWLVGVPREESTDYTLDSRSGSSLRDYQ